MYKEGYFPKDIPRKTIAEKMRSEGFDPTLIRDKPNFVYSQHQHPETKLLVCLEGGMRVIVEEEELSFKPGDRLLIPGTTPHSAIVEEKGCVYFWSEKVIEGLGQKSI